MSCCRAVPGHAAAHVEAIRRAAAAADVVLTTGGTAAGPVDHLHAAIAQCDGEVVIDSVAVRPGHPMLAATLDRGRALARRAPGEPAERDRDPDEPGRAAPGRVAGRPALPDLVEVPCAEAVGAPAHEDRLVLGRLVDGAFAPGSASGLRDAARAGCGHGVRRCCHPVGSVPATRRGGSAAPLTARTVSGPRHDAGTAGAERPRARRAHRGAGTAAEDRGCGPPGTRPTHVRAHRLGISAPGLA